MVIDFGEAEIFKRQMPQAIDRVVGSESPSADLLEKFADGFGVQEAVGTRQSAFSRRRLD